MVTITYFSLPKKILVFDFCKHIYIYVYIFMIKQLCVHIYILQSGKMKKITNVIIYSYLLVCQRECTTPALGLRQHTMR